MVLNPVDLFILRSDDWPADLFARALASTEGQPVNVHVVPYRGGQNGRDRAHGYRQGSAPYVAFLDADDELIPGGLAALLAALESDPSLCGAYGIEERMHPDGRVTCHRDQQWSPVAQLTRAGALHNATLKRRAAVLPYLDESSGYGMRSDRLLRGLMVQYGPWRAVPVPVYRWHLREGTLRSVPQPHIDRAVTQRLAPILMSAAKRRPSPGPRQELTINPAARYRQIKARTREAALTAAREGCGPCQRMSFAGVEWIDAVGLVQRMIWQEIEADFS